MKYPLTLRPDPDDGSLTPLTEFEGRTWVLDTGAHASTDDSPLGPLLGMDVIGAQAFAVYPDEPAWESGASAPASAFRHELMRPSGESQPWVPVRLGSATLMCCVDTGASLTVVDASWASAHPELVTREGMFADGTDAEGASVASEYAQLASLGIGGLEFAASRCAIADLSHWNVGRTWPIHVLLGWPVIAQADWWFDTSANAWAVWR